MESLKPVLKKVAEWVGLLGTFAVFGSLWINTEVERRMGELASDPASNPVVVANTTKLQTLSDGQKRIEGKVDAFSTSFLQYLERQAAKND